MKKTKLMDPVPLPPGYKDVECKKYEFKPASKNKYQPKGKLKRITNIVSIVCVIVGISVGCKWWFFPSKLSRSSLDKVWAMASDKKKVQYYDEERDYLGRKKTVLRTRYVNRRAPNSIRYIAIILMGLIGSAIPRICVYAYIYIKDGDQECE
jgi:hypothetical protein